MNESGMQRSRFCSRNVNSSAARLPTATGAGFFINKKNVHYKFQFHLKAHNSPSFVCLEEKIRSGIRNV